MPHYFCVQKLAEFFTKATLNQLQCYFRFDINKSTNHFGENIVIKGQFGVYLAEEQSCVS